MGTGPYLHEANRRILVVDDESETLKGYLSFLGEAATSPPATPVSSRQKAPLATAKSHSKEFEVTTAATGEEAIAISQDQLKKGLPFAGGFFDVKLGAGIDGLETIRSLKKLDPHLRCVVVTAYHDRSVDDIQSLFGEAYKDHWDYLNKPFNQGEIMQKARQMIAAWNRSHESEALHAHVVRTERLAGIGQLARSIGHEFGNILLRIMGKADLALQETQPEKVKEHLEIIKKASDRAAVIVRNMQSFSSTDTQKSTAPTDLGDAVQEALSLINHELVKHSITTQKEIQPLPLVPIDRGSMAQVFLNLMINATHAMPQGGTLTLRTFHNETHLGCHIIDTGTGIPVDVLPRIFEFGYTTKGDKGSGLGLALSKQIVEAHGGSLSAENAPPHGARFTVSLPLLKPS